MSNLIQRSINLNAPIERVWKALTDHSEFGTWFRVDLDRPFVTGQITSGKMTYPGYEGVPYWMRIERIEEPVFFSFVWPIDETVSPDDPDLVAKTTRVRFTFVADGDGTRLEFVETGFENLPEDKRMKALRNNEGGWDLQIENIRSHVE